METSLKHALTIATLFIIFSSCLASTHKQRTPNSNLNFLKKSCNTTLYPRFCYAILSPHANKIGKSSKLLSKAALSATLSATRSTSVIMTNLTKIHRLKHKESMALHDCIEEIGDSLYELRRSIKEMNNNFERHINDIQTWVSAALTDDGTCTDGFDELVKNNGNLESFVRRLIFNIARLTSITLAFINLCANG